MRGRLGLCSTFVLLVVAAGCFSGEELPGTDDEQVDMDAPLQPVVDPYYDVAGGDPYAVHMGNFLASGALGGEVRYHSWQQVEEKLQDWEEAYPHLVELDVIGESREGRSIWRVILTDESTEEEKLIPLLDGGHHGNEYGGSEIVLYTVDLLLENHATNRSVQRLLRELEIHAVPVVNPDGYVAGTRHNAMGVNLNRNYDVDWGNPAGTSNPVMGRLGEALGMPFSGVALVAENSGPSAFSEPETQAMRELIDGLGDRAAFYLTGHTPTHAVIAPPAAFDPPFSVPDDHRHVLDASLDWIRTNTEYEAGRAQWGDTSAGLPYAASGSSMDYYYATLGKPAFTIEVEYFVSSVTASDYPFRLTEEFEGLRYWMDASLPVPMHLLANAAHLAQWQDPVEEVLLPEGYERPVLPEREPPRFPYLH